MKKTMLRMLAMLMVLMMSTAGMASAMTAVEPEATESAPSTEASQPAAQPSEPTRNQESHADEGSHHHSAEQPAAGNDSGNGNNDAASNDNASNDSSPESSVQESAPASNETEAVVSEESVSEEAISEEPVSEEAMGSVEENTETAEVEETAIPSEDIVAQEESNASEAVVAEEAPVMEVIMADPQEMTRIMPMVMKVECVHTNEVVVTTTVAPTCYSTGSITETTDCPDCGRHLVNVTTLAITENHEHDVVTITTVAPTCKTPGSITETNDCQDCGRHLEKITAIAVTEDHVWDDGVVTIEPEIGKVGEITYTCLVCGLTRTEEIPALEPEDTEDANAPEDSEDIDVPENIENPDDNTAPGEEEPTETIADSTVTPEPIVAENTENAAPATEASTNGAARKAKNGHASIVTNKGWKYLQHDVKEERTEEGQKIFHVIAPPKADGTFVLRYLVLTPSVLREIRHGGFTHISYEMDDALVVVPVSSFTSNLATQGVAALDLDIDEVTFVIMLDPKEDTYAAGAFVKDGNELIEFFDLLPSISLANSERPDEYAGIPYRPFVELALELFSLRVSKYI